MMQDIYIVGLQESGGMWCSRGRYYTDFNHAMIEVNKDRSVGIKSKVFTLSPVKATEIKFPEYAKEGAD